MNYPAPRDGGIFRVKLDQNRVALQAIRDQVPLEVLRATTTTSWSGEVGLRGPDGIERSLDVDLLFHRWRGMTAAELLSRTGDLTVSVRL